MDTLNQIATSPVAALLIALLGIVAIWRAYASAQTRIDTLHETHKKEVKDAVRAKSDEWREVLREEKTECKAQVASAMSFQERIITMLQEQSSERDQRYEQQQNIMERITDTLVSIDGRLTKLEDANA